MGKTSIEWTERSWNPVTGCSKVSPGCDHCYAEAVSLRFKRSVGPWTGANARANVVLHPERLGEPLKVRKPSMFFTCSMGDLFHDLVPWGFIVQVFNVMAGTPWHTYQVLTKRPGRMAYFASEIWPEQGGRWEPMSPLPMGVESLIEPDALANIQAMGPLRAEPLLGSRILRSSVEEDEWPRPAWPSNVWAGTTVESAKYLPRLDVLARVAAAVCFVSAEPLLGALDLTPWLCLCERCTVGQGPRCGAGIQWVIAGGESGPGFRKPDPAWFRSLRDQCQAGGVPFFFKQWGGLRPGGPALLDGREWREMPDGTR